MSSPASRRRSRYIYFLAMAALALVALARTAYFQLSLRAQVIERNFDMAALQARAFEDHLTQSFDVISQTLANLAEVDPGANATAAAPKEFTAALRNAGYLRSVARLDAHGAIIASSNPRNLGRNVALTDFFPPRSALAPPLRVGPPWSGRDFAEGRPSTPEPPAGASAEGFLPVLREVVLDNGSRVMLLAAVDGGFFINHYGQVLDSAAATVDLLRYDGAILLSTRATRAPGVRPGADAVATRLAQSGIGRFEQRLADGRDTLTAYRASRAYPFVIVVHLDKAQVLAGWREEALTSVAVTIALLLAASMLATWNYFRLKRSARSRDAAKAALQASEAQYRNTFEHAAVGIAHATREGRFLRCNQHLCDLLGYSAEELNQKTVDEITCPDDLAQDLLHRQRLLGGEIASYQFEKRYVRNSGELVWARVNAGVVRDAAGAIDYRVAVIEDIHLHKLTVLAMEALNTDLTGEAFLRQMTRTLATLLDVECVFVAVAAPGSARRLETRALFVDGEFVADFSYDLAGTPCDGVVGNELCIYAEQVQALFPGDAMLAAMGIESYAAVPLGGAAVEGGPLGVLGVMSRHALRRVDAVRTLLPLLASRAGAELVREREAKKFRDLFDSSPSAIFLIDHQSTVRMSSRAGERLFGWAPQALGGQQVGVLFPTEHRDAYEALFRRFVVAEIVGEMDSGSKDMWGRRRDGSAFPAQVQMRVLETAEGRMTVAHVQDITVRKQAESALRQLNEELESKVAARTFELSRARDGAEQANRAKSAFLAAMSHEIRTPMNGVVGMIDVLEQSALRGEQVEIVKTVRESAHALLAIVDDVLDFSKIEAGQFEVDHEPMEVAAVVEAVCDGLDHLAAGKGVVLTLFTDPALPVRLLGDAPRLRQVLLNLIGNAIKFSSAQGRAGRVAVRAGVVEGGAPRGMLEFSVTDNGIGMDQATQARLFTPFTQADTSTTRRYGGTGLGLSISHGLVELMGGEIAVRSEAGVGSTFTVRLPLAPLPAAAEIATNYDAGALHLDGLCCLVLGGPRGRAEDLTIYVAHGGAVAHRVADLAAARRWFADCPPGLCIVIDAGADDDDAGVEARAETLAGLRAACASRPGVEARFVVLERGRRRWPRVTAADLVSLDRDVLRRRVFMQAVALAAGRIAADAPAPARADEDTVPAALSIREASAQGRLILVAEDNEINRKVIQNQLALLGFTAHLTRDGREALECSRWRAYPLLLTDLHMPEMDGYALAAAIRAAETADGQRRMPIVALTANALQGEAKRCRDLGMDDYMTKPVQLTALKAMLDKWLPAGARPMLDMPASPTDAPASSTALDVRVLKALVGDEPAVIAEFLHDFRASAGAASAQLRAACQARQAAAVEALAHRLKSSARSVGALALGDLCAQLEQAGGAGQIETLTTLWPGFETEMAAVNQALEAW